MIVSKLLDKSLDLLDFVTIRSIVRSFPRVTIHSYGKAILIRVANQILQAREVDGLLAEAQLARN